MIRRELRFNNFRNLGLNDEEGVKNEHSKIILNYTSEGKTAIMGGIIPIIGLNNCGKSNVIDALKVVSVKKITKSDSPDFVYEDLKTDVGIYIKDEKRKMSINYNVLEGSSKFKGKIMKDLTSAELKSVKCLDKVITYNSNYKPFDNANISRSYNLETNSNQKCYYYYEKEYRKEKESLSDKLIFVPKKTYKKISETLEYAKKELIIFDYPGALRILTDIYNKMNHARRYTRVNGENSKMDEIRIELSNFVTRRNENVDIFEGLYDSFKKIRKLFPENTIKNYSYFEDTRNSVNEFEKYIKNEKIGFIYIINEKNIIGKNMSLGEKTSDAIEGVKKLLKSKKENDIVDKSLVVKVIEYLEEIKKSYLDSDTNKKINEFIKVNETIDPNVGKIIEYKSLVDLDDDFLSIPEIIDYDWIDEFSTSELVLDSITSENVMSKINESTFFKRLLSLIGDNSSSISKAFSSTKNGARKSLSRKLNNKLSEEASKFNKLYFGEDNDRYSFEIELENNRVSFLINEESEDLNLDLQSVGFGWFFSFYFNIIAKGELKKGTIVVMDEPGAHLHARSQEDLRRMMKKFGEENGVTFVYTTHSIHMTDIDNFDELRLVKKDNLRASVYNHFQEFSSLEVIVPIEEAFTVDRFRMMNPLGTTVFVEGVTDYNYLTAFKNILNLKDIHFIPINGIKDNDETVKFILENQNNPIFLVDADDAGMKFHKSMEEKGLGEKVIAIREVLSDKVQIEDLFSEEDKETLGVLSTKEGKSMLRTGHIKNVIINNKDIVSNETVDNFKKLIDYLLSL